MRVSVCKNSTQRELEIDDQTWFVAKDVANALGAKRTQDLIRVCEKDEVHKVHLTDSLKRNQESYIINESGIYSLILGSKLDSAKRFNLNIKDRVHLTFRNVRIERY